MTHAMERIAEEAAEAQSTNLYVTEAYKAGRIAAFEIETVCALADRLAMDGRLARNMGAR